MSDSFDDPMLGDPFDATLPDAPYPGLRTFYSSEWPIFFGRETMTDEIIDRIIEKHMIVIHGDSGCGKSSIARAGALVQLQQGMAAVDESWRTCAMRPREDPLGNLAEALGRIAGIQGDSLDAVLDIRHQLSRGKRAAATIASLMRNGADDNICILVDQFEELFRYSNEVSRREAQIFVDFLTAVACDRTPGIYVIITMRSEFLGNCARYPGLAEIVNATQYLLPRMERASLLRAIREPAALYGGEVSMALAARLISDAREDQDELPLIQHGLMQLWRRKTETLSEPAADERAASERIGLADAGAAFSPAPSPRLELDDLKKTKGLRALLSGHANRVLKDLTKEHGVSRSRMEHVFRALIDINADGLAIRRPVRYGKLRTETGLADGELRVILDAFRTEGVNFITPFKGTAIDDQTIIDISHEALIRSWSKIAHPERGWLRREFEDGLTFKSLTVQAQKFEERGELLSGPATRDRLAWTKRLASQAWVERYQPGKKHQEIWAPIKALLRASESEALARVRREGRFRRIISIGAILLTLVALGTLGFAYLTYQQALEIERHNIEKLVGDSHYRAVQSRSSADDGEPVTAVQLALAGLPTADDMNARPWVAGTAGALVEALAALGDHEVFDLPINTVTTVANSADGSLLLAAGADGTLVLIDRSEGGDADRSQTIGGHSAPIIAAAFAADDTQINSVSNDGRIQSWSIAEQAIIESETLPSTGLLSTAFGPGGSKLVVGYEDGSIGLLNGIADIENMRVLDGHTGAVQALAFSGNGQHVASGGTNGRSAVWDFESGTLEFAELPSNDGVADIALSNYGAWLASSSTSGRLSLSKIGDSQFHEPFFAEYGTLRAISFSPDDRFLAGASEQGAVEIWDVGEHVTPARILHGHQASIADVRFTADGSQLITGAVDGTMRVWDPRKAQRLDEYPGDGARIGALATGSTSDGAQQWIISGNAKGDIDIWSNGERRTLSPSEEQFGPISDLAMSPDVSRFAVVSSRGRCEIYALGTATLLQSCENAGRGFDQVAFSADGTKLALASNSDEIFTWNIDAGALSELGKHQGDVRGLVFSPDGTRLATASSSGEIMIWEPVEGRLLSAINVEQQAFNDLDFAPDGKMVVTASADERVSFWPLDDAGEKIADEPAFVLAGHSESVTEVAFASSGGVLVSAARDGAVIIWNWQDQLPEYVLEHMEGKVASMEMIFDGTQSRLVTGTRRGTLHAIPVPNGRSALLEQALRFVPRDFSDDERDQYNLSLSPYAMTRATNKSPVSFNGAFRAGAD